MTVVPTKDVAVDMTHILVLASQFDCDVTSASQLALIIRIRRQRWGIIRARQVLLRCNLT
jgi:hypothetical protein